eukprot:scaffold261_cov336-Pavlova_lutheri.AAC.83
MRKIAAGEWLLADNVATEPQAQFKPSHAFSFTRTSGVRAVQSKYRMPSFVLRWLFLREVRLSLWAPSVRKLSVSMKSNGQEVVKLPIGIAIRKFSHKTRAFPRWIWYKSLSFYCSAKESPQSMLAIGLRVDGTNCPHQEP